MMTVMCWLECRIYVFLFLGVQPCCIYLLNEETAVTGGEGIEVQWTSAVSGRDRVRNIIWLDMNYPHDVGGPQNAGLGSVITSQWFISTRCGKTTVCQMLALLNHLKLHMLNCHMHSDTADFIGSLRPVRDGKVGTWFRLFRQYFDLSKMPF